jgi:chromosomal replication initiator protein
MMQDMWKNALADLRQKVSVHNFESWFQSIEFDRMEGRTAYVQVADEFMKAWIEDNYLDLIEDSIAVAEGHRVRVVIDVFGERARSKGDVISLDVESLPVAARQGRFPVDSLIGGERPSVEHVRRPAASADTLERRILDGGLNPRYVFEEFVVGPSNQFVHAASQAVANRIGCVYNPLFIFGGVGLGKTHLLQAIGIEVLRKDPSARVVSLSAEEFMNQLIMSLRQRDMNAFRTQFRNRCDVLLIDDIQFIGGKDSTQEEFFHTFNALHQAGKQIVITSDKPPKDLPGIEERLASRFSWGLIADVQPPSVETRAAILEKKAEADGMDLDSEVSMMLASTIRSNIRELEGTLIRLGAQASLLGTPVTRELASQMLRTMNLERGQQITVDRIIRCVADFFDVTSDDLRGSRRVRFVSAPRHVAMFLARKHTAHSFPEIGRKFGGKDHTTVLAACRKIEKQISSDEEMVTTIEFIEARLF